MKLPRLFSIEQVPQVRAVVPVVELQAGTRAWPLQRGDCYVFNRSALCTPTLFKDPLPDSLGEFEPPVSLTYTKPGNGSDPKTV